MSSLRRCLRQRGSDKAGLQQAFSEFAPRINQLIAELAVPLPQLAEAVDLLDKKIEVLGRLIEPGSEWFELDRAGLQLVPTHDVNLSGCGLAHVLRTQCERLRREAPDVRHRLL